VFSLVTPQRFLRRARKFLKKHPDLRGQFTQIIADLQHDPYAPHLTFHHLSGKLKGIQAVSITGSYRITLTIFVTEKEIVLLDVGSHDEVYF